MQTFLPDPDFDRSARLLDRSRLGKQRLEALTLLLILRDQAPGKGWRSHPALRMWRGHPNALARYGIAMCREWRRRGYVDNLLPRFEALWAASEADDDPWWLGTPELHASHRSNLLRKDPLFYGMHGWAEGPGLPYLWPVGDAPPPGFQPGRRPGRPAKRGTKPPRRTATL